MLIQRLTEMLHQIDTVHLIGAADTESSAVDFVARNCVDVMILDLNLKQGTGFGVMRALAHMAVKPRIVVLTNYDLPEYKTAATALGAAYFLDKANDYGRLAAVLQEIGAGPPLKY